MYSVFIVYGVFGLDVCSVYEAFALVFFFWWGAGGGGRLECLYRFWGPCGVYIVSSVYGVLGWDPCGVYCVSSVNEAFALAFFLNFYLYRFLWRGVA